MDHIENSVFIFKVQQYVNCCTETGVCVFVYRPIAVVCLRSAQQRVYAPQYLWMLTVTLTVLLQILGCVLDHEIVTNMEGNGISQISSTVQALT
jgi:hypothetical protein